MRSAGGCIAVLDQLSHKIDLLANFYCFGSGAVEVERHRRSPQTFAFLRVDKSVADDAVSEADVLISIGDNEGRQVSAKYSIIYLWENQSYIFRWCGIVSMRTYCRYTLSHTRFLYPAAVPSKMRR